MNMACDNSNSIKTGEGLWTLLESEGCCVPPDLRKILTFARYDNLILLAKMKEDDSKELVKFMREDLHTFLKEEELPQYYGVFHSKPQNFKFMPGEAKLLILIAETSRKLAFGINNKRPSIEIQNTTNQKKAKQSTTIQGNDEEKLIEKQKLLLAHVKKYIDDNIPNLASLSLEFTDFKADESGFHCKVNCPVKTCKYNTALNTNQYDSWITTNFYKHLRTHAAPDPTIRGLQNFLTKEVSSAALTSGPDEESEDDPGFVNRGGSGLKDLPFLLKSRSDGWARIEHSKSERRKRKLAAISDTPSITTYFPVLNEKEVLVRENQELRSQLLEALKNKNPEQGVMNFAGCPQLLIDLFENAQQNAFRKSSHGNRFKVYIKSSGELCYLLGGVKLYQFLHLNLRFPAISTIRNEIHSTVFIKEGEFRIKDLKEYLVSRQYPLKVILSEDATRIVARIGYHPGTNQVVGFVLPLDDDGLPVIQNFPATSAQVMADYFKNNTMSNYAYAIMAQPIASKAPAFLLALFGTDNKFTSSQVLKRWRWERENLRKEGIEVVAKCSDGDPRMMKAMCSLAILPAPLPSWSWFQSNQVSNYLCFQDFVHLLVKLKSRFLKPSVILPLGPKYVASKGHLIEMMSQCSKDLHCVVTSHLDSKDKMNFRSAEKICSDKVTKLLRTTITSSLGTVVYLTMMREIYESMADPSLQPLQRIELNWTWVIFLRIWRNWVNKNPNYVLGKNFITRNAYLCIELNAHALIQLIIKLRDEELCILFKPWLFTSQACESLFRLLRALSTVLNTIVNFSFLEMSYKVRRMERLRDAFFKCSDRYKIPGNVRAFEGIKKQEHICSTLPENCDIEKAVHGALNKAVDMAMELQLIKKRLTEIPPPALEAANVEEEEDHESENEDDNLIVVDGDEFEETPSCADVETQFDEMEDVLEDLTISTGPIGLKTFNNIKITEKSPFVKVRDGSGNSKIIKKSSYLWLLSSGDTSLSSDRLQRVKTAEVRHQAAPTSFTFENPSIEAEVFIGQWCAFISEDDSTIIGRILSFSFISECTSWKQQEYSGSKAAVENSSNKKVGCMCSWFKIGKKGILIEVSMDSHGYYSLDNYICTIPRPEFSGNKLHLSCSIKSINDLRLSL